MHEDTKNKVPPLKSAPLWVCMRHVGENTYNTRVDLPQLSVLSCSLKMPPSLRRPHPCVYQKSLRSLDSLPPSVHPQQSVGVHTRRRSFVASMLPHRTWARSVHSHLLFNKSKLLVTDWNTAFCCFPCCTDNGVTHTRTHAHTQYVAVLHPCLLSESRCGSMMHLQKNSDRRREYNWSFGVRGRLRMCLSLLPSRYSPVSRVHGLRGFLGKFKALDL